MQPKKSVCHTVSILTGRKKARFSHLCSSVIPYPIGTKFATKVLPRTRSLHAENHSRHFCFFLLLFTHFAKSAIKHQCVAPIGLKFGTLKGLIKAGLSTKFGWNLINIHRVMTVYFHKIWSKFCHAHRVNPLEE